MYQGPTTALHQARAVLQEKDGYRRKEKVGEDHKLCIIQNIKQEFIKTRTRQGMRRSESNLITRRGSDELPARSSLLRRALSSAAKSPSSSRGRRGSESPFVHCQSSNSLGQESQSKHMPRRLRSAQSLSVIRSSRSSRDSFGSSRSRHQRRVSGGPNAEFGVFSDKITPIKPALTSFSSPSSPAPTTAVQMAQKKAAAKHYVRINIRYKNDCGRAITIATSNAVYHDVKVNRILNVTIPYDGLAGLERSENIEWVDRMGAIHFDM